MKCPFCGNIESRVLDSRPSEEWEKIRRRRECTKCLRRFTTYETIETTPLMVIKKDGTLEPFIAEKLKTSLLKSCEKRQISVEQIEKATSEIEAKLLNSLEKEVSTSQIGELAMEKLKKIDEAAYVRFASVYRQFKDINSFMEELEKLKNKDIQ